jgi:hypothetical protein
LILADDELGSINEWADAAWQRLQQARDDAAATMTRLAARHVDQQNRKKSRPSRQYMEGDQVRVRLHPQSDAAKRFHAGFAPKWSREPHVVSRRLSPEVYEVRAADGSAVSKVSSEEMKPFAPYDLRGHAASARDNDGLTGSDSE